MNSSQPSHPNREQLERFVLGKLSSAEQSQVESHVADCDSCCDVLRAIPQSPLIDGTFAAQETKVKAATSGPSTRGEVPSELADHPRYRIIKKLGAGGMGVVYQAEHRIMERLVAIKVIGARFVDSEVAVERFHLEVKAAARITHRNIVTAFDAERAGDAHFLVMEFIKGENLFELVQRRGPLPILHSCNYVMQAAQGLSHAWEKGMVHRDIKPHNLMRTNKGTIKILDFGLARFVVQQQASSDGGLTGENTTLGTPDYIAPEQARDSKTADIRADIYSLGCTLYYLLSGKPPFPSGSALEKVAAHFERQPVALTEFRSDVPHELVAVVDRMMAKDVEDRYQTPTEVVDALMQFGRPNEETKANASEPKAEEAANTLLDFFPTQELENQGLPVALQPAPQPLGKRHNSSSFWQVLRQRRGVLGIAAAGLVLLVAGFLLIPRLTDMFAATESQESGSASTGQGAVWVDLVAQIQPQDSVAGQWSIDNGTLRVDSQVDARIVLPFQPPAEYDFEVQFTRLTGRDSIALIFVAGQGQAAFDIDAWRQHLAGIQNINGQRLTEQTGVAETYELVNGRRYTALVRVRRGRVDTFLDGRRVASYEGDGSNLSVLELWQIPSSRSLGVGAYDSATAFHRIRVRPVNGN